MARSRITLEGELFRDYMDRLDKLGGSSAMKTGVESALKESKNYVNPQITQAMGRLPAGGKYSHGGTLASLDTEMSIDWRGMTGEIKVGFDFSKSGMKSIFLMYGTPRMDPVAGLKNAIYGTKTQRKIAEIQEDELLKIIDKIMGG